MNKYLPEGSLISTSENRELISSLSGLEKAMQSGKILEAMAIMCDGDLSVTVDLYGIKGIIPKNEMLFTEGDTKDIAIITRIGKPICFKVIGFTDDEDGKKTAILSRRSAQAECMRNFIMSLIPGDIISAKVTHMERFGAFVDIGCGIISLMSIDSISVSRIAHPKDRFTVGMNLKTVVKSIDYETGRVYVSLKELLGTWEENAAEFQIGQTVAGTIRSIEDYGVFIELAPNLTGLAEARDGLAVGQNAAVYIKNIIPERMKVKLVIIDVGKKELHPREPKYYLDSDTHIDRWVYSPSSCQRVIESIF
ncbi:MAG: S1 RNA-binding domain-containing protein [Clostridia bacterium]|nr:S1 RNA-binding domain-containing protein [Clostridia bacterium]